ncbi:unnamed protein product [Spirodela intermedia]|uniref:RING-type E3 ubiquitin transferase n=1 Tax=Spirodela intermedia TaxID=51605 RepID=A0A7I8JLQ8_SPIIN|nr:unnamed protein product [Spirodela intermedia]CAA6671106.1 unnamed protein product [Spirodela intermedia]
MASGDQGVTSAPLQRSVLPRHSGQAAKSSLPQRYGLRNLSCSSISDVIRSGCADADRKKLMESSRRRCSAAGKGSTPRGKSVVGPPDFSSDGLPSSSVLERPPPRAPSRARNQLFTGTARPANGDGRMRLSRFSGDSETLLLRCRRRRRRRRSRGRFSLSEAAFVGSPRSALCTWPQLVNAAWAVGLVRRRRLFEIATRDFPTAVLLALERLEQEEELTHENDDDVVLSAIDGSPFDFGPRGIGFPDQHRDWRLDIDDMTYEELLALEEKMGTVSTALSEKQLLECLESSLFRPSSGLGAPRAYDSDDTKCSICQEEYGLGDEMGKLHCGHRYHMGCIHQWLRQKNWCPVCKSSASPSSKGRD